jgi:hypothetical protein
MPTMAKKPTGTGIEAISYRHAMAVLKANSPLQKMIEKQKLIAPQKRKKETYNK